MIKRILVLANSIKHGESCIAGKDVATGKWIRLVSDDAGGALPGAKIQCIKIKGGTAPVELLNVVEVDVVKNSPLYYQPENFVVGKLAWKEITEYMPISQSCLDSPDNLWGTSDKINPTDIKNKRIKIDQSLYLVQVNDLKLYYRHYENKLRRRVSFSYNGISYDLASTDKSFDAVYHGELEHNNILCLGLGELHRGSHYKLNVGIF